jgi:hypothetical protein
MKTAVYNAPAEIVSDGKKIQFKMSASPKAFSILADGIYADKITAVIRELSTNAWDSHVQAGNKNPFDVHLPTTFNQNFFIRDYGVGLSEEEIETIYTTFFDSNKTDSNDYTGGLGLGSKTPFCYHTKSFVITSIKNGVKLIYSAYIDEMGFPSLVKMSEEPSDEATGVKVEFPVKSFDVGEFKRKAENVYKWFGTKPNFVGYTINLPEIKETLFLDVKNNYIQSVFHSEYSGVVMGNIFYPYDFFSSTRFLVYCDIGSLDIETSREGLAFTEKTKRRLEFIKKTIEDQYQDVIKKEIGSCKNMWEAMIAATLIRKNFGRDFNISCIEYKGQSVDYVYNASENLKKSRVIRWGYSDRNLEEIRLSASTNNDFEFIGFPGGVYINDSSYAVKRVKDHSNSNGRALLIPDQKTVDEFCDWLNFPKSKIVGTSTLPLNINRKASVSKTNKKGSITVIEDDYRKSYCFQNLDIDFSTYDFTNHYYVISNHYDILDSNGDVKLTPMYVSRIQKALGRMGINITVLATTKTQETIISSHCDKLWNFLEKLSKNSKFLQDLETNATYYNTYSYNTRDFAELLSNFKESSINGHMISDFVNSKNKYLKQDDLSMLHMYMEEKHNIIRRPKYNPEEAMEAIKKRYPLIEQNKQKIVYYQKYIQLVDQGVF